MDSAEDAVEMEELWESSLTVDGTRGVLTVASVSNVSVTTSVRALQHTH